MNLKYNYTHERSQTQNVQLISYDILEKAKLRRKNR